jgi:hypothetical protein
VLRGAGGYGGFDDDEGVGLEVFSHLFGDLAEGVVARDVVLVGGGLDVDEDDVGVGADGVVVGDVEGGLLDGDAVDELGEAGLIALKGAVAAVEAVDLPAGAFGAALDAGDRVARDVGEEGGAGDAYVAHADDDDTAWV